MTEKAIQDFYPDDVAICYGCGRNNPDGLKLKTYWNGKEGVLRFKPKPYHTAFPGVVYGGLIACLVDCNSTGTAAAAAYQAEGREPGTTPDITFVTGNLKDGTVDLNWPALAVSNQTVVFYMGLKTLSIICDELIKHGRSPNTPAAIVQQGTTRHQRVLTATLATLPDLTNDEKILPPTLIIVGEVVQLHDKLAWFEPTVENESHWDDVGL